MSIRHRILWLGVHLLALTPSMVWGDRAPQFASVIWGSQSVTAAGGDLDVKSEG
ncbi:MAG TPA: hypothetical protein VNL77_14820 [Roseiflexaceae bacterium]|nr:hypothetical protein [Roseiflexaceae bacterium]